MRDVTLLHDDWRFLRGDAPEASRPTCDDQDWGSVTLPHDWAIEGPYDLQWASATGYLPGGIGWYRKTFTVPPGDEGRRIAIRFDGVYRSSDMYLNGHHLGHRPSGFVGFEYDLTPYLFTDKPNTLAVRVDHHQFADARWYTGSGINRNVYLITVGPVHFAPWGIFVSTPVVTSERSEIRVETTIQNHGPAADVEIAQSLRDPDGAVVAETRALTSLAADTTETISSLLKVSATRLWSPEHPALYRLQTTIFQGGKAIDREETTVGIRSIRFDADQGFFLNGQNLKMKGVCLHDDAGALGTAVPPKVWERRLNTLKAAGVNAIRMAHNPHMPALYDLCDRLGFLVQDEAFDEWEGGKNKWVAGWNVGSPVQFGYHEFFDKWAEADLRAMIFRDRNHPCVVMWSIGNEIDYPNDPYSHEVLDRGTNPQIYGRGFQSTSPHASRLGETARYLAAIARDCDSSRPVTAGLAAVLVANEVGLADALDAVGYNYQEGRYPHDHADYPRRVIYGSENGMRLEFWQAVENNPYICGQFLWTGIDYLGEAGKWPTRSNGAGLLDLAGFPKPEYYYRQSLWADAPMVYLGTRDIPQGEEEITLWTHKKAAPVWAGESGALKRVQCFSNCEEAELFLNGRSLGIQRPAGVPERIVWWDVPYEPGTLTVQGSRQGRAAASDTLQTSGSAKKIVVETDTDTLRADGVDVVHLAVTITDDQGVPVYDADHEITWEITGPARLLGLESGDHDSHEDYQGKTRKAFQGRLLGYVQAGKTPGTVTIHLTAPGLEDSSVCLEVR